MGEGSLSFAKGITLVFCDHGPSQKLQADFTSTVRTEDFNYGVYYHIGFWGTGPHLLQGSTPLRIRREFERVIAKSDTEYAIINVCNLREHVLGVQAATEIMSGHSGWSEPAFWDRFAPRVLHGPYQRLLATLFPLDEQRIMQDGALFAAARKMLARYDAAELNQAVLGKQTAVQRKEQLPAAIAELDALIAGYPAGDLTARERAFFDVHFLTQAKMLRELYTFYLALIEVPDTPGRIADAESALQAFLAVRKGAAAGKWADWYRGDKKVNVPALLEKTRAVRQKLASP
jgi:hypothetical protein